MESNHRNDLFIFADLLILTRSRVNFNYRDSPTSRY